MEFTMPVGIEFFETLRASGCYYVDKSEFIYRVVGNGETSDKVNRYDVEILKELQKESANEVQIINSLLVLTRMMYAHYGRQVILLIDEYDVPLANAHDADRGEKDYYPRMLVSCGCEVESNQENGLGRTDIVIRDRGNRRAIIIEAKKANREDELEKMCLEGSQQIVNKKYMKGLKGYTQIVCYGLSFFEKTALARLLDGKLPPR